jgi:hypothetical protein
VFHVQLRQFPHNHCRFNLSEPQLAPILDAWAQDRWVSFGERKWSPHQAKLTIIEGPRIALAALSMGRGWRHVEREGNDVTLRLLEQARTGMTGADAVRERTPMAAVTRRTTPEEPDTTSADTGRADQGIGALLGGESEAAALLAAWRAVTARSPQLSPSERLALAELQLRTAGADPSA